MTFPDDYLNKVLCGDCLEVMKGIPDNGVDIVITSIPFNAGKNYGETYNDSLLESEYFRNLDKWIFEMVRVAKVAIYIFTSAKYMNEVRVRLPHFVQYIFWHRPNIIGTGIRLPWIPTITPIAMSWKSKRLPMINAHTKTTFDFIEAASPQSNFNGDMKRCHVAQDPVEPYFRLLARTPNELILDPFVGSGTSCVAAKLLGRQFIGIEISEKYCEIARKRIDGTLVNKKLEFL